MGNSQFKEETDKAEKTKTLILKQRELTTLPLTQIPKSIQCLDVTQNSISLVPSTITQFVMLTEITLSRNRLEFLSKELFLLPKLENLRCSNNLIKEIPTYITLSTSLKMLNLYANQIRTIPSQIEEMKNLKEVLIAENYIDISCLSKNLIMKLSGYNDQHIPSKITDNLYFGSYTSAKNLEELKNRKITNILTLGNLKPMFPTDFIYKIINIEDNETEDFFTHFEITNSYIDEAIKNGTVLVHCAAGVSRSGAAVIAYVMTKNKLSYEEAYKIVSEKRPCVSPNSGFIDQLLKLEKAILLQ